MIERSSTVSRARRASWVRSLTRMVVVAMAQSFLRDRYLQKSLHMYLQYRVNEGGWRPAVYIG